MLRIAGGDFRLVIRLLTQAARIQEINGLAGITVTTGTGKIRIVALAQQ